MFDEYPEPTVEELRDSSARSLPGFLDDLSPIQRFVLSVLLFFNVVIVGFVFLVFMDCMAL